MSDKLLKRARLPRRTSSGREQAARRNARRRKQLDALDERWRVLDKRISRLQESIEHLEEQNQRWVRNINAMKDAMNALTEERASIDNRAAKLRSLVR